MADVLAAAPPVKHAPWYPEEPKKPHRRCDGCGRFLKWNDYYGTYMNHTSWDDYAGGWEYTCF
ncbi:MAG TPA: hypothetical protein VFQ44_02280 [Streptosporangiaceae bacterium]|nr:hypothetical protein [Streptosporangiaceae bacterium]